MLAGVIVDDPATTNPNSNPPGGPALDLGENLHLVGVTNPAIAGTAFPTTSDLALRLLRAFFVITSPSNWKDYSAANVGNVYQPNYPAVDVRVTGGLVVPLKTTLESKGFDGTPVPALKMPAIEGWEKSGSTRPMSRLPAKAQPIPAP